MTNSNETDQDENIETAAVAEPSPQDTSVSEPITKDTPPGDKINHNNKSGVWLSATVLLLLIGVAAVSGYTHWWQYQQNRQQQSLLREDTETLRQRIDQQARQLQQSRASREQLQSQLSEQLRATENALQQQRDAQNILAQQLEAQNQRLLQLSSANSENWELAEALYLTRLANQRLVMEQNRNAALALLEGADEILSRQQNPELFPVREQLNQDISALKVVAPVDREGLFLQLSALSEQLQQLPLTQSLDFQTRRQEFEENLEPVTVTDQNLWQRISGSFKNAFGQLDQYVRKVDLEGPAKPLLSPSEQESIRLAVTLQMESAQIALLRAQPLVFKNALQQARQQLTAYYPESSQRQELILTLQSLQDESVKPELPDISRSYLRLNEYVQNHAPTAEQPPAGEVQ